MKVLFLDFDGVINTTTGYDVNGSYRDSFNSVSGGIVNNHAAIQLVNRLCREFDLAIVVSSKGGWRNSLRRDEAGNYIISPYKRTLYDSGLDEHTYIFGHTPATEFRKDMEIKIFLEKHPEIDKFIILEDCIEEIGEDLLPYTVVCDTDKGFTEVEYRKAVSILRNQPEIIRGNSYQENR